VPVKVLYLRGQSLGEATIDLRYDPAVIHPTGCHPDPGGSFTTSACDLSLDEDGIHPDSLRLTLTSTGGVQDSALLANVTFQAVGGQGMFSALEVTPVVLTDPSSAPLTFRQSNGLVCIAPCQNLWYLPFVPKLFSILP
jgi:hypothetical protein